MGAFQDRDFCLTADDEPYNVGDTWSDEGKCNLKICTEGAIITEEECELMPPPGREPQGCKVVEGDMNLKFPDCCPRLVCANLEDTPPEIIEAAKEDQVWEKFYYERVVDLCEDQAPGPQPYVDPDYFKPEWTLYDPAEDSCA